jgi:hypothetical protein
MWHFLFESLYEIFCLFQRSGETSYSTYFCGALALYYTGYDNFNSSYRSRPDSRIGFYILALFIKGRKAASKPLYDFDFG